jgi:site-specific recombinase XerD
MKTVEEVMAAFETAALNAGLSRNTRKSYAPTICEFATMLKSQEISGPQAYFNHLSSGKKLNPNTVRHALNPLKFLYEKVLGKEFGQYDLPKRSTKKPMRSVLAMSDIVRMMETMDRVPRLQAGLLAGGGLRIESDMLTLRLKDVRLSDRIITIYDAKGDKTRPVRIPECLVPELETQIRACRRQWEIDHRQGIICPHPQDSLMRKLGRRTFSTLPWYWLFPSSAVRGTERWHATDKRVSSALRKAAADLGITQRVNPHALRHSYATSLMRNGIPLPEIQEQMGHTSIETTMLYLHTEGTNTTTSPLDFAFRRAS